ncbi:dihydroorotate dehydrogenase [Cohnella sp.]|uniref:dihydroorotate dehydrogenase n=1 Tax=Cohnella sp. TaxID=1883426 RepID=UPI003567A996
MSGITCNIAGVTLRNPVIMASGTFGYGREYAAYYPLSRLGGIATKGLTLFPRAGNPGVRVWETAAGMLNSVGLENPGVDAFISRELDWMLEQDTTVLINLGGGSLEEYVEGAARIDAACRERTKAGKKLPVLLELNISCPNVKEGGMAFGIETATARSVVRAVREATGLPLVVKLSPNARDIVEMARMCEAEGADAVSLINSVLAMKIDIRARRSIFRQTYAGLSGPAIKPIALRIVHQTTKAVGIPVIGIGGIASAEDALEFVMAGAEAVQVGTWNFVHPCAGAEIAAGITDWMCSQGVASLDDIRGIV